MEVPSLCYWIIGSTSDTNISNVFSHFNLNVKENGISVRDEIDERSTETFALGEQKRKEVDVKCISDEFTGTSHNITK